MLYGDAEHVPMATLVHDTLCATFNGLSKIYRACGYRVGWVAFSGDREQAADYLHGVELLSSLRLCANVPGQWAVQTALGGFQSIREPDIVRGAIVPVSPGSYRRCEQKQLPVTPGASRRHVRFSGRG